MKTFLKPHNVEPVKKALSAFNAGEQRVALAHATGTGKSYATCAIIELGNFKNVLYLSPSNHINNYFEKVVIKNLGNRKAINILATYCFLLHRDLNTLAGKFDLIILDEYHRVGAEEWGKAVKKVLELNQQAKVLGLTATEVRYCDNWKDMSKELNFNVVSRITLVDAIERHILPAPEYIIGFSDFDRIITELEALAIKCKADKEYLEEIKKIKVDWINSDGLAGIIKRHLPITTSKIVVFSEAIELYEEIEGKMTEILTAAGFRNLKFLRADSNTKGSMRNIEYFSTNNDKNEVKVIISVNMLNEGIHAEGAEACFMFRKTRSANIFLQQLGRVESSLDHEKRPVVFDLVNNISNDWELFTEIGLKQQGETIRVSRNCVKRIFGKAGVKVTSYVENVEEVKRKLNRLFEEKHGWDYTIDDLKSFVNKYGHLPRTRVESEKRLGQWMYYQINADNKEVVEIYEEYKKKPHTIQDLIIFVNTYNRLPVCNSDIKHERTLYEWMHKQIKLGNKEVIEIYNRFSRFIRHTIKDLIDFVNLHNRLPGNYKKDLQERSLHRWMYYQLKKGNQEVINIYNRFNPDKPWKG